MKLFFVFLVFALLSRVSEGGSTNKCLTCQQELEALKTGLFHQLTQESTSELLDIICESFPENDRKDCTQNIATQAMPILTQLKNMNVEGVCAALDQCGDDLKLSPFLDVNFVTRNGTTDFELEYHGMICAVCTTTMNFLHTMLSDRSFQQTILRVLTRFCYFTGPLRRMCLSFLHRYGTMIIDLAEAELTPKLCKALHLCNRVDPMPAQMVSRGMFCSVCKRVTSTVHFLIHNRDNQRRVIALAKYMCHKLPSPFSVMCDGLVSFALPELFDYLRSNCQIIDNLCKKLGFCPRQSLTAERTDNNRYDEIAGKKNQRLLFVPYQRKPTWN